ADTERAEIEQRIASYSEKGVPKALAQRMAIMQLLPPSLDIVRISRTTGVAVEQVGRTYFAVGARFGLDWLRQAAAARPSENHWDKQAVVAVTDDFYGHQRELTTRILGAKSNGAADPIETWSAARGPAAGLFSGHRGDLPTRIRGANANGAADPIETWSAARGPAVHRAESLVA